MPHLLKEIIDTSNYSLADYKDFRYEEIDHRTEELILEGFTFDSTQFSLSIQAQQNWSEIHTHTSDFTFPLDVTTLDNNTYSLDVADVNGFWTAAKNQIQTHLDSGRSLKKQVYDAVDRATAEAVIDTR